LKFRLKVLTNTYRKFSEFVDKHCFHTQSLVHLLHYTGTKILLGKHENSRDIMVEDAYTAFLVGLNLFNFGIK
jgi:predicted tellurium resistance membrane protein TerC